MSSNPATPTRVSGRPSGLFLGVALATGLGAVFQALLSLFSARWLSDVQVGAYFIGLSIVTLGGMLGRLATEQLALRDASPAWSTGDRERFNTVARTMLRVSLLGSLSVGTAILIGLYVIFIVLRPDALVHHGEIWLSPAVLVGMNLVATGCALLRAADRTIASVLSRYLGVFAPAFAIVAVSAKTGWIPASPMFAVLLSSTLVASTTWTQLTKIGGDSTSPVKFAQYRDSATRITVSGFLNAALTWSDRIILGVIAGVASVEIYGVAWQFVLPFGLIAVLAGTISAPSFSRLHVAGDLAQLETAIRSISLWMFGAALLTGLGLLVASSPVLNYLGSSFGDAQPVVAILIVGQIVNLGAGPIGDLYVMVKQDNVLLRVSAMSAAVSLVATIALTAGFGINGTAAGVALGLIVKNVSLVVIAPKLLGIAPVVFLRRRHEPGESKNVLSLLLG